MKKIFLTITFILVLSLFIIPKVALAAWWNPFTWRIFNRTDAKTEVLEKRIQELESKLGDSATTTATSIQKEASVTTSITKKEVKQIVQEVDNYAVIQAQIREQVEAQLKAKADQDALIAKQEADEQVKLHALKAEVDRRAAQNALNIAEQQAADQQAIKNTAIAKQKKLNEINKKIADLNAKYAKDIAATRGNGGATLEQLDTEVRMLNSRYDIDYSTLMAEFQQIKYSD